MANLAITDVLAGVLLVLLLVVWVVALFAHMGKAQESHTGPVESPVLAPVAGIVAAPPLCNIMLALPAPISFEQKVAERGTRPLVREQIAGMTESGTEIPVARLEEELPEVDEQPTIAVKALRAPVPTAPTVLAKSPLPLLLETPQGPLIRMKVFPDMLSRDQRN